VADQPLEGRTALVTGASKNIGRAIALELALAGADVVITGRDPMRLDAAAAEMRSLAPGRRILPVAGDAANPDVLDHLAAEALRELGGIDVLVANAVFAEDQVAPIVDSPPELWDRGMRGFVLGPLRLIRALHPRMAQRGHGSIITILSTAGFTPIPGRGAYGVMKSAMWTMTRYLAMELAPEVRVNALCPGTTSEDGQLREDNGWLIPAVPLGRMGRAAELAQTALFLSSDASSYTTGQVVFCDGGRVSLAGYKAHS